MSIQTRKFVWVAAISLSVNVARSSLAETSLASGLGTIKTERHLGAALVAACGNAGNAERACLRHADLGSAGTSQATEIQLGGNAFVDAEQRVGYRMRVEPLRHLAAVAPLRFLKAVDKSFRKDRLRGLAYAGR